jgi:hypothetical protein
MLGTRGEALKRMVALPVLFLLLVNPGLFAEGDAVKITIRGADLKTPMYLSVGFSKHN